VAEDIITSFAVKLRKEVIHMALRKKDAKRVALILTTKLPAKALTDVLGVLAKTGKSKSFRRSIKRISDAVEQAKKPAAKKAA
jgi:hypothetical protein